MKFISFEPLLETMPELDLTGIDWAIVGLESGKNRRDASDHINSLFTVVNQCLAQGVPIYVKQDLAFKSGQQGRIPDEVWKLKQFPQRLK